MMITTITVFRISAHVEKYSFSFLQALGGVHQVAVTQLKRLGATLARHTGSDEREVVSQLLQRISFHLMRGNSALISGRRPDSDLLPPELDGIE